MRTSMPANPERLVTHNRDCTWNGLPELAPRYRVTERLVVRHARRRRIRRTVSRGKMLADLALFTSGGVATVTARGGVIRHRVRVPGIPPVERVYRPLG
ncbi:hypothetical protein ACGRHY_29190 [Streptomyces sp. HK10]|uniref:hypothetical protein n=1 Tax=Streptomyces sp. HK10 TaxID=3373255 RepID=UPI0037493772